MVTNVHSPSVGNDFFTDCHFIIIVLTCVNKFVSNSFGSGFKSNIFFKTSNSKPLT